MAAIGDAISNVQPVSPPQRGGDGSGAASGWSNSKPPVPAASAGGGAFSVGGGHGRTGTQEGNSLSAAAAVSTAVSSALQEVAIRVGPAAMAESAATLAPRGAVAYAKASGATSSDWPKRGSTVDRRA